MSNDHNVGESFLRLFLSVDLHGSTAFKHDHLSSVDCEKEESIKEAFDNGWPKTFSGFYTNFPTDLKMNYGKSDVKISLWKGIGDELVFVCTLESGYEIEPLLKSFYKTLRDYDKSLLKRKDDDLSKSHMRLKGTAWTAGFPFRNKEIRLSIDPEVILDFSGNKKVSGDVGFKDYIGPDIDSGFRMSRHSRPGRLAISPDLADIIVNSDEFNPRVFHVGWEQLKGVHDGGMFPVFWYQPKTDPDDCLEGIERHDNLTHCFLKLTSGSTTEEVKKVIGEYRDLNKKFNLHKPYLITNIDDSEAKILPYLKDVPESDLSIIKYLELLKKGKAEKFIASVDDKDEPPEKF